jgi:hypothetical protein
VNISACIRRTLPTPTRSLQVAEARVAALDVHTVCPGQNRRFWRLSAQRTRMKAPYKTDLQREMLRALSRPGRARAVGGVADPRREAGPTRVHELPVEEDRVPRPRRQAGRRHLARLAAQRQRPPPRAPVRARQDPERRIAGVRDLGFSRIVTLHYCSTALYQIH